MPEAVAAPAVVPTPKTVTPTPAPVVAPPATPAPDPEAKYKALETDYQRKSREAITERRKGEALTKESAAIKAELAALKKRDEGARLNPIEHAKALWGENWHAQLNEMVANGGAPPAQLIQAEMAKLREENDAKWKARDDAEAAARETAKSSEATEIRSREFRGAAEWYRANASGYPILETLGAPPVVARLILERREAEFYASASRDESGRAMGDGKIITTEEAAGLIETQLLAIRDAAGKHEKYKAKLQPPPTSATVPPSKQQQGQQQPSSVRRSLTNHITGSTSPVTPPMSAKERRERVLAAYEANRTKG